MKKDMWMNVFNGMFQQGDRLVFNSEHSAHWYRGKDSVRKPFFFKGGLGGILRVAHSLGVAVVPFKKMSSRRWVVKMKTGAREFSYEDEAVAWQERYGGEIQIPLS